MGLDVYLHVSEDRVEECEHCHGTGKINHGREEVYSANITHNLNAMANAAGIYEALWRPEEYGITKASQLIPLLRLGLQRLRDAPTYYQEFNPDNGWGDYHGFVRWLEKYLTACEENPEADVIASR